MSNGLAVIEHDMDAATALVVAERWAAYLAECTGVDEVKLMRDRAKAVSHYLGVRGANEEAQRAATIMKIDAERRLGELIPRNPNGRPTKTFHDEKFPVESPPSAIHRWHTMADLPADDYAGWRQRALEGKCEPSSSAVYKLGHKHRDKTSDSSIAIPPSEFDGCVVNNLQTLVDSGAQFSTIYADPPWRYGNQATRSATSSTKQNYDTMTVEEICSEPVAELAAEQSHLHLWTTNAFLFDARQVIEAWGFEYKSCFVWVKPNIGMGNYWRLAHEFLLLGVRGGLTFADKSERSWMELSPTLHSRKPREVREAVERVSPGPYLEMYGREPIPSPWTVYGNQIDWNLFHGKTA